MPNIKKQSRHLVTLSDRFSHLFAPKLYRCLKRLKLIERGPFLIKMNYFLSKMTGPQIINNNIEKTCQGQSLGERSLPNFKDKFHSH